MMTSLADSSKELDLKIEESKVCMFAGNEPSELQIDDNEPDDLQVDDDEPSDQQVDDDELGGLQVDDDDRLEKLVTFFCDSFSA